MPSGYDEHVPLSLDTTRVECFWTTEPRTEAGLHRVLPDGCIDFLYTREGSHSRLDIIGAMTAYRDFQSSPGLSMLGVRFRPGALSGMAACGEWTDQAVELAAITPRDARHIKQRLDDEPSVDNFERVLSNLVANLPPADPVQRAIAHLTATHGQSDLTWLASQANLSERQFRRLVQARTGLRPKQLARILRFRRAQSLCRQRRSVSLTDIALECGYFDQAHFIHEFQHWSGRSPLEASRNAE